LNVLSITSACAVNVPDDNPQHHKPSVSETENIFQEHLWNSFMLVQLAVSVKIGESLYMPVTDSKILILTSQRIIFNAPGVSHIVLVFMATHLHVVLCVSIFINLMM